MRIPGARGGDSGTTSAKGSLNPELARRALIALDAFFALGAIAGGLVLLLYPSGGGPMQFDLEYLQGSPFVNYFIPGLFLAGIGFGSLGASLMHLLRVALAPHLSFVFGALLVIFEAVEATLVPFSALQPFYFAVGLAMMALATQVERDDAQAQALVARALRSVSFPVAALVLLVLVAVYATAIRPWFTDLGATRADQQMPLAGDELNPEPVWQATRAITINAPVGVVWAWLIQHGQDRAGFYSYDWLENLTGADIHNVDELRPGWQRRSVGDSIPLARPDLLGGLFRNVSKYHVSVVEPGRALVTGPADESRKPGTTSGVAARILVPVDDETTRLIWREREGSADSGWLARAAGSVFRWSVWEPMHFVMQYGMMRGIKARAEGNLHEPEALYYAARAGWLAAGVAVAASFCLTRKSILWLALPLLATQPAIILAGDVDAALAGFIATGITTAGALRWGGRWWPFFLVLAAFVLLVLLLTAEAFIAFGLIFAAVLLIAGAWLAFLGRRVASVVAHEG
ncbi:MAG TPA: hypothetical protein VJB57_01285 [Dehalococcoidia bacterium]|nr:hypothetical protein [Dehalococcoidia bacterium]